MARKSRQVVKAQHWTQVHVGQRTQSQTPDTWGCWKIGWGQEGGGRGALRTISHTMQPWQNRQVNCLPHYSRQYLLFMPWVKSLSGSA